MKYFSLVLLLILCFITSCTNDKGISNSNTSIKNNIVNIYWEGEYEYDGCGFFIQIGELRYKASNEEKIGNEFKTSKQSPAQLEYIILDDKIIYHCGDLPSASKIDGIEIISIQKLSE